MRVTYAQRTRPDWAQRLDTYWTAPAPFVAEGSRTLATPAARMARAAAWPLAILLIIHRVFVLARQGSPTDDFTTVWAAARRFVELSLIHI